MAIDSSSDLFYFNGRPKTVDLLPGMHFLNTGASIGGMSGPNTSNIYFNINQNGEIDELLQPAAADVSPDKKTIILRTGRVTIDPGAFQNKYYLSAWHQVPLSRRQDRWLVLSQSYAFDSLVSIYDPSIGVSSYFYFSVDEKGNITPRNLIAATGSKSTLRLKTVSVMIDPDEISSGLPIYLPDGTKIERKRKVSFARGLLTWVTWNPPKDYYYFVPM